jgi:hypothetical protein
MKEGQPVSELARYHQCLAAWERRSKLPASLVIPLLHAPRTFLVFGLFVE